MRYLFPLLLCALSTLSVWGQDVTDVDLLRATFGDQKVDWLVTHRPEKVDFMAFVNAHGYYVADVPNEKAVVYTGAAKDIVANYPGLPATSDALLESGEWGMLGYALEPSDKYRYYEMDSGRVLVVLPEGLVHVLFDKTTTP